MDRVIHDRIPCGQRAAGVEGREVIAPRGPGPAARPREPPPGIDDAAGYRQGAHIIVGPRVPGSQIAAGVEGRKASARGLSPGAAARLRERPPDIDGAVGHRKGPHIVIRPRVPGGQRAAGIKGRKAVARGLGPSAAARFGKHTTGIYRAAGYRQDHHLAVGARVPVQIEVAGAGNVRQIGARHAGHVGEFAADIPAAHAVGSDRKDFSRHRRKVAVERAGAAAAQYRAAPGLRAIGGEIAAHVGGAVTAHRHGGDLSVQPIKDLLARCLGGRQGQAAQEQDGQEHHQDVPANPAPTAPVCGASLNRAEVSGGCVVHDKLLQYGVEVTGSRLAG